MFKNLFCQYLFLFAAILCVGHVAVLSPSVHAKAPENYQWDSEKSLPFEWAAQKYEWNVVSYVIKDDLMSHGASGALHVVLNKIDGEKKTIVASTSQPIFCGSYGFCEVFHIALEQAPQTLPLLQIQAGVYAGQGHVSNSAFLLQVDGDEIQPVLCWFAERQGECAAKEYKFTVQPKLIIVEDRLHAVELQAQGTRCSKSDELEVQNRKAQISYQKMRFTPDASFVGELTCYPTAQD